MPVLEREAILGGLDTLLGRAVWHGGRLVLVRGEAGIGKSTLVKSFTEGRRAHLLWGTCDPVALPRPLGPLFDMAEQRSDGLARALESGDRHRVSSAFLGLLRADGGPWIAVFEDVQWADDATLELLKVVGRRVDQLPALVIATVRDEEVGAEHPLSLMLGDVPTTSVVSVPLPALSLSAVQELVAGTGVDAVALHRAAGGNPFFVTEVLASGGPDLPSTVRDAVMARANRLDADALRTLRAAAVLGPRCDLDVLGQVSGLPSSAVAGCVSAGMLRQDGVVVEFPHELSQRAVLDSIPSADRVRLHEDALRVLHERVNVAPAELARQALEAGDAEALLRWAPQAARAAAALGAHRSALMHYDSALPFACRLPSAERAPLLAAHASECYVADDLSRAIRSQEEAVGCWRETGDTDAVGVALVDFAHLQFWFGELSGMAATIAAVEAQLETMTPGPQLAYTYARRAQIALITGALDDAIFWGNRALASAELLGEEKVVVHALNTVGSAQWCLGHDAGERKLEESLQRAEAADLEDDIARALNNLLSSAREHRRYEQFDRYADLALKFSTERDLDLQRRCLFGDLTETAMDRGRWEEACANARTTVEGGWRSGRFQCLWVLGLISARRGDRDAFHWLDLALAEPLPNSADLVGPLRVARAEAAWLAGDLVRAAAEIESGIALLATGECSPWVAGRLGYWSEKLDLDFEPLMSVEEPYALHHAGYTRKAAALWATIGCPYEQAMFLSECDREEDLRRSLDIFLELGAAPMASRVTSALKDMGARGIARGARAKTRANPSGLSDREMEVLELVAGGLRNAEIAERLVVSPKTVDHHVSAVLAKLGARDRHEAVRMAGESGFVT